MTRSALWMVPVVVTVALACTKPAPGPQADAQADVAAINAIREREMAFANSGNMDSLLTVYTSDVVFMPPNERAVIGQEAVKKWGDATLQQVSFNVRYTSSDVNVSGDWGIDHYAGVFTVTPKAGGSPVVENIKGVHVMKRQSDGTWRIAQDVWNSDAPPPPSAPAAKR
jgi:ketosteroid isomerase-like protein